MIIGSHDSLTYIKSKGFLSSRHKRQNKTIIQQLRSGVHALDLNFQFDVFNNVIIISKDGKYKNDLQFTHEDFVNIILDNIRLGRCDDEKIYIKLTLVCDDVNLDQDLNFIKLCKLFKNKIEPDDNIILCDGTRTCDDEKIVVTLPSTIYVEPIAEHVIDSRWYEKIFPKLYAKRMNEKNKKLWESENIIVFFDFI